MFNYNAHIGRIVTTHKSKDAFLDLMTFLHLRYYNLNSLCKVVIGQSIGFMGIVCHLKCSFMATILLFWEHVRLYLDERVDLEHILTGSDRTQGHVVIATCQSQDRNAVRPAMCTIGPWGGWVQLLKNASLSALLGTKTCVKVPSWEPKKVCISALLVDKTH